MLFWIYKSTLEFSAFTVFALWNGIRLFFSLNGLQHLNAGLIEQGLTQGERFQILYRRARRSVDILEANKTFQQLKGRFGKEEQKKIAQVMKKEK